MNAILSMAVSLLLAASISAEAQQAGSLTREEQCADNAPLCVPALMAPTTEVVDVWAAPRFENHLPNCHLVGDVTLWVTRRLSVLDDMNERIGNIEAGLAQFGKRARLEGCVPDGSALVLADRFVNFLVADDSQHEAVKSLGSLLAQDFHHLAEPGGALVPLVEGYKLNALGSVAYQFTIVLVRDTRAGSFDVVIQRETVRTKFCARLSEAARRDTRLAWSS